MLLSERRKLLRRKQQLQKKLSTMFVRQPGAHVTTEEKTLRQQISAIQQDMDYIDVRAYFRLRSVSMIFYRLINVFDLPVLFFLVVLSFWYQIHFSLP